jgi:hypothetical protein
MRPSLHQRFEQALGEPQPFQGLYQLAGILRDEGLAQIDVYSLFAIYQARISGDDPLYDAVVDTMDEIHGGPWAKRGGLFPTVLTEEMISKRMKND